MSDNVGERFETDVWMDMCTELLPPVGYPIAVKYIISYIIYIISYRVAQRSHLVFRFVFIVNIVYCPLQ